MANVLLLKKDRLTGIVSEMLSEYRVIAPVLRDGEVRFERVARAGDVTLDYRNTLKAPKAAFFPQTEALMRYRRALDRFDDAEEPKLDRTPTVLLGARPCDARSFLLLDRVFCEGCYVDPYYRARRQSTLVVALACEHPRATCFCHATGGGPYDRQGADVFVRDAGDAYLIEAVTARGSGLLAQEYLPVADEAHLAEAERIETAAVARLPEAEPIKGIEGAVGALYDSPIWQDIAAKCIACGTCTYVCPECHCFNIEDRALADGGERVRAWDACMYSMFTQHASGHNPRPDQASRWRQRTEHKFAYLPRNVELYGCVGCGRCVLACPVRLDIREVLRTVRREYERVRAVAQEPK